MKSRIGTFCVVLALVIGLGAALVEAQTKPNLSGTWKMNASKSKFASGGPDAITIKFDHQEPKLQEVLTLSTSQGERTINLNFTTDGKEIANQFGNNDAKGTAKWEGNALVTELKSGDRYFRRTFTLSEDGKTMTIIVRQSSSDGEKEDTVVLEKQ